MKTKHFIWVLLAITAVSLTGCSQHARTEAAQQRWENTIDQARLEAAAVSIEQGRIGYARKVLEDVRADSNMADEARQMMSQLENSDRQLALDREIY